MTWFVRGVVAAGAMAAVFGSAGCALPAGVDGDLAAGWGPMPEPEQMVPEVGMCHNRDHRQTVELGIYYQPRDCSEPHQVETVYVGEFTGEVADRDLPPNSGTTIWREAYQECDGGAAAYLGADFRHGRLWLGVAVPTRVAWEAGARWFSCELVERRNNYHTALWQEGDRRGALAAGASALSYGCMEVHEDDDSWDLWHIDCSEPHEAEFVGVWHAAGDRYPTGDRAVNEVFDGCYERVAEHVGVPFDSQLRLRAGVAFDHIDEEDWDNGDRGFRCYLWVEGGQFTESLAGAGTTALPVR